MTVFIDNADIHWKGLSLWYHMTGDDADELHEMAEHIGVARKHFQGDHYDITAGKRVLAVKQGAVLVGVKKMAKLRRQFVDDGVFR